MKGILVKEFGGPEVCELTDLPIPKPDENQVNVYLTG
jgi:NADPH:quinone reductase-like Zn-dependent oxidoreductase